MKLIIHDDRRYVLRFDKGDEVISNLKNFMAENKISACTFQGIGSCSELELGFYSGELKDYEHKKFKEDVEILSLIGNGALEGDKPIIHAHGTFSGKDYKVFGGHIFQAVTFATCEVFLIKLEGQMHRAVNSELNLKLLQ